MEAVNNKFADPVTGPVFVPENHFVLLTGAKAVGGYAVDGSKDAILHHDISVGKKATSIYSSLSVFLLGAVALIISSGYSLGAALLLLGGLAMLVTGNRPQTDREDRLIIGVLVAFFAINALEAGWDGQGVSGLDLPIRFVLAIPALMFLMKYPPRHGWLWSGLALGAMASGSWAGWQKLVEENERARGFTHVIQYGDLNMLMGVMCLAGLGWACTRTRARCWMAFLAVGACMGIFGSLMSGSRGGWIGFPIILWVIYRTYRQHIPRRWALTMGVTLLTAMITAYTVPSLGIQHRVNAAFSNVTAFYEQGDTHTSLGARFAMWETAIRLIPQKPLAGYGLHGYEQARDRLIDEGVASPVIGNYSHVHNEYLDAWLKRGIPGLVLLLALYLVPLKLFTKRLAREDLKLRALALAGVLLPINYMDFGLSQVFMAHNSGVMMYSFWLVVLWASVRNRERHLDAAPTA